MWMYIVFKEVQKCVCQITETFKDKCPEYDFLTVHLFLKIINFSFFFFCHTSLTLFHSNQSVMWPWVEERWSGSIQDHSACSWKRMETDYGWMDTTRFPEHFLQSFCFCFTFFFCHVIHPGSVYILQEGTQQCVLTKRDSPNTVKSLKTRKKNKQWWLSFASFTPNLGMVKLDTILLALMPL